MDIEKLVEIGKRNPWIKRAWDPEFDADSFITAKTFGELCLLLGGVFPVHVKNGDAKALASYYGHQFNDASSNWCTGTAVIYKNYAFINQVNGGDEWLTIRYNPEAETYTAFESITFKSVRHKTMRSACLNLKHLINRWDKASDAQLKSLDF